MPNRFDIFITRLETKSARDGAASHSTDDQHHASRDKSEIKPARSGETSEKDRAKHRHKHEA
ncbi:MULTISPECIES: hypothetical protein [unclassified Mesorhizobium]|uniref:hypothetical protein n=1 Tax=unclassified Mesorhizobium TaxID=325217 RepID=UPI0003CECFD8|nr:hypothetical protein [Mesorhizobium sp. LSJC280B00]ESW79834.1 hypothetical protein X772_26215 [Mesorhizobium sp. LSJC280B00]MCP9231135.1 hypothetical protein [Mesorhizobium sp. LMG 17147]